MKTPEPRPRSGETLDSFYRGRIRILQEKKGYRFSVDAPLLADFLRPRRSDDILEIGTGTGIISLLLSIKPFGKITAIEIQEGLAGLARRNIALNGLGDRVEVVHRDFRDYAPVRKFDLVFSNPPYIRKSTGHLSASAERSVAKHEIHGDIGDLMRKTAEWLKPDGRACFIYPERRRDDFMKAVESSGLRLRLSRSIHPRKGAPANLFLAEIGFPPGTARAVQKSLELPPLYLFGPKGTYAREAERIFSGRPVSPVRAAAERKRRGANLEKMKGLAAASRAKVMSQPPRPLAKRRTPAGLVAIREDARRRGKIIVFTNGCFDVLHDGHVRLLRFAKKRGDILMVAVNSDASVRKNKGPGRPIFPLRLRLQALDAIAAVDYLASFSAQTPIRLIRRLRPDVLVKGADWEPGEVVGRDVVEAAGGRVLRFPIVKGLSSTRLIRTLSRRRKRHE